MTPPSVRIEKAAPPPPLRPPSLTTLESPTAVAVRTAQRGAGQRKWPLIAAATIAVLGVLVLSAGIISRLRRKSEATAPAPAPTTVATAVTELPLPATSNAEALAAYREGLQRLRNASWSLARNAFEQATKLDPSLGAAYLRMAIIDRCHFQTALSRSGFQRAVELRTSLTEREQLLLDAFEPVIQRDPPDWMETRNRLEAAKQKYPGDAEFIVMVMIGYQMELPPERMLELTDQCLELDDRYADCWQGRALALFRSERIPEAIEALDHCLELAPAATDCLTERIRLQKIMGRCGRLEADARRWLTKDQSFPFAYQELAVALEAGGQSLGAVGAAVEQAARRFREAGMPEAAGRLRINLALLSGHFDEAERLATQLARDMAGESQEDKHAVPALALVRLYWETGQDRKAGEVADDFLSRRAGWVRPVRWTPWSDPEPRFLKAKHRAGLLDDAGYVAARDGWVRGWQAVDADPAALWLIGKAAVAHTEAEARAALSESLVKAPYALHPQGDVSLTIALLGDLAFLSGRYDEALPRLEEAARSCTALDDPIRHTVATYRLGVVHESRKEKAKACAAYKVVLRRWAQADGSLTAKDAARRAKELACAD
jgi:serine/threonine-protein kinase